MSHRSHETKDTVMLLFLGALLFFGALFLFVSINEPKSIDHASSKNFEQDLDRKINSRISAIEAKIKFKKNKRLKPDNAEIDSVDQSSLLANELEVFKTEKVDNSNSSGIVGKTIEMVNSENETAEERMAYIESYKKEYKRRAKLDGWDVELNDQLEVVSAKRIKNK